MSGIALFENNFDVISKLKRQALQMNWIERNLIIIKNTTYESIYSIYYYNRISLKLLINYLRKV